MHRIVKIIGVVVGAGVIIGAGCMAARSDEAQADEGDQPRIARLEREARAIAKVTGCSSADACRTAPVGARPCGGPRTFVVYCAASTDTVKLFAKLRELERAEQAWNAKSGLASTCEMRMAPLPGLVGGRCGETVKR